jgi:hypothetical protein
MITPQDILNLEYQAAIDQRAPHVLMRPKVYPDGDQWCALYGDDLQSGVCGFGKTPEAACANFDLNWQTQQLLTRTHAPLGEVGGLVATLRDLLTQESPMHPIGCATWEEAALYNIERAADALERLAALKTEEDK